MSNNANQTIPSVAVPVIPSFTPQAQAQFFSNPITEIFTIVKYATGLITLLFSDLLGGFIIHTANTAFSDTLPTAALLVPQIQGAQVGTCIFITLRNNGTATLTIAVGVGGTANTGDTLTITTLNQRTFMLQVTATGDAYGNGATYTLYSLGSLAY